jgi:hypothetical protein
MDFIRFCYIISCGGTYEKCKKNRIIHDSKYENKNNNIYNYGRNKNSDDESMFIMINGNIYTECAICYDITALKEIKAIYPCGHRLYCENCIKNIKDKCPTCNTKIHSFINIYENLNDDFDKSSELVKPNNKNKM